MNSTAISGIVRLEASKMRRKTPHDPPDRCWIIIRPSDPIATPSHSRKPISQARKKWSRATTKPTAQTTRPAMPTCRARVRTAFEVARAACRSSSYPRSTRLRRGARGRGPVEFGAAVGRHVVHPRVG